MFRIPSEKQQLRDLLAQANEIIDTQAAVLESERQWRLNSLPTLLETEARAKRAEARVAELEADLRRVMAEVGHHEVMVMGNHGGAFVPLREALDHWRTS